MNTGAAAVTRIRQLLVEYQDAGDPALLDAAVSELASITASSGFADIPDAARAYLWALGASALALRARTPRSAPDDVDRSIAWAELAVAAWPQEDPKASAAQANLATALVDRYERDRDQRDLERAAGLFEVAETGLRASGGRLDVALHSHGCCLHELAKGRESVALLDRAIELFSEALEQPEPTSEDRAGYLNSMGLSLRAKGQALADPGLLASARETYRQARRTAPSDGEAYVAASINLAVVLQDLAEVDNDLAALREAVGIYRKVLPHVTVADQQRTFRVTTNLSAAMIDLYRHTRDRALLDDATGELRSVADRLPDGPSRDVVLANLAAALHEMFDFTGRLAVLDQAIAVQELLLARSTRPMPERMLNLGVSLLARHRRRRDPDDLVRAIRLFGDAARATGNALEAASAMNSEANARSLLFDESQDPAEIDRCVALRRRAIDTAPPGSLDRALYEGNLGVDLLKRHELRSGLEDRDLREAVECQHRAVDTAPPDATDQPALLAGLADSLACLADLSGAVDDVEATRATYRRAIDTGLASLPEQALGAAVRWGEWESRHGQWPAAVTAYRFALAAIRHVVAGQHVRSDKESWLADAVGVPAAAGVAASRAGNPVEAAVMLEDGRAVLLAEVLERRRFVSVRTVTRAGADPG